MLRMLRVPQLPKLGAKIASAFTLNLHGKRNALARHVHFKHRDSHLLMDLHHIIGILHEPVCKLADVNESILMHADIHKSAEGRNIRDDARQLHTRLDVLYLRYSIGKGKDLELFRGPDPAWQAHP